MSDTIVTGADASGQPASAPATTQPATQAAAPEYVSKDEFRTVLSGMLKNMLPKVVQESMAQSLPTVIEKHLTEAQAKAKAAQQEPAAMQDSKQEAAKPSAELIALQKKIADLEKSNRETAERYAKERQRAIEANGISALRQSLSGKLKAEAVDIAADLIRARGQLVFDDDGNPLMRVVVKQKGYDDEEQKLPLGEAIGHYLKSKEAELFLPPPSNGAGGAKPKLPNGSRTPNGQFAPAGQFKSPSEAFEALGFGALEDNL